MTPQRLPPAASRQPRVDEPRKSDLIDHSPTGAELARALFDAYRCHDARDRAGAIEGFAFVDVHQFPHLSEPDGHASATALVDALWEKDRVEEPYVTNGVVECPEAIARADWSGVEAALQRRARIIGMPVTYASWTTTAWIRHKSGGDYVLPVLKSARHEVQAALGTDTYPDKPRGGQSGFGELPTRYLVAVELHDLRTPQAGERIVEVLTPYFETILEGGGPHR